MIDEDLRSHYAALRPGPDAEQRVLAAVAGARQRPTSHSLRTGLAVAGSVAAVGAVSVAVTVLPGRDGPSHTPAAGSPTAAPMSAAASSAASSADRLRPVTPQVVVQNLMRLVSAKGTASQPTGRSVANSAVGEIRFDDGHGAAQLDVALTWSGTGPKDAVPGADICATGTRRTHVAGWKVQTAQGNEYPRPHPDNSAEWSARAFRSADGLEVDITEWNAPTPKGSPISRATPPFTLAELISLATSPTWHATVSSETITSASGLFTPESR